MASSELTPAQREILRQVGDLFDTDRLDRIWIFDPHLGNTRESGILVFSLFSDSKMGGEMRELITIRYSLDHHGSEPTLEKTVMPEGWAPPDRIDSVITGVLARSGDAEGDPREEVVDAGDGWEGLLFRLDLSG